MADVFDQVHQESAKGGDVFDQVHAESQPARKWTDSVADFAKGAASQLNPIEGIKGLAQAAAHPIDTAKAILGAQGALGEKAMESFKRGDHVEGVRHAINYLIPVLGPSIDEAGNKVQDGKIAEGLGEATGMGLGLAAPAIAKRIPPLPSGAPIAERMYQSALKPRVGTEARGMVRAGLDNAIPISEGGADKIAKLVGNLNDQIQATIAKRPGATVDPYKVAGRVDDARGKFAAQVNPVKDLRDIDASKQEFLTQQGERPGQAAVVPQSTGVLDASGKPVMTPGKAATPPTPAAPIPAGKAQALKVGTYQQVAGKYGELSGASVEAQKALARGLKEELEVPFPELKGLNAKEGSLLDLQGPLERAVRRVHNREILGAGTHLAAGAGAAAGGPPGAVAATMMKAVLDNPELKSRIAIAIHKASQNSGSAISVAAGMERVNTFVQSLQQSIEQRHAPLPAFASSAPSNNSTPSNKSTVSR